MPCTEADPIAVLQAAPCSSHPTVGVDWPNNGLEIVFDSTRGGGTLIYTATRPSMSEPWSTPVPLDSNVNLGSSQMRASISRDGTRLYFGSNAANQVGDTGTDIFVSTRSGPGKQE